MRIRYTPRARSDLQSILQYIDERNPGAARSVKRALQNTIGLIGEFPQSGRPSEIDLVRVLPAGRYPYPIYWTVEATEVWLVHIRDGRRRPWKGER